MEAGRALTAGDFPVGCVLVDAGGVVAAGHRINSGGVGNELDHAEMRALHHYVESRGPGEAMPFTVYCTMEPCLMCYSALVLHGADTIIYGYEDVMGGGCSLPPASLPPLFREETPAHHRRRPAGRLPGAVQAILRRSPQRLLARFPACPLHPAPVTKRFAYDHHWPPAPCPHGSICCR
jgi:tRNA(Arg) A34 adenosine deaminase TadA